MKRRTIYILCGVLLLVTGVFLFSVTFAEQELLERKNNFVPKALSYLFSGSKPLEQARPTFRIGWSGDLVPGDHLQNPLEHALILKNVQHLISMPDLMVVNLEGVLTRETNNSKCERDPVMCYAFRGEPEDALLYAEHGIDAMTVANNHTNDFGDIGRMDTVETLSYYDITPIGAYPEVSYILKNNVRIGLLAFSPHRNSPNMNDKHLVSELVKQANDNADIVVVFFHGGAEGLSKASTPLDTEYYLGEDRGNVREFAYNAINAGADLVLGAGPHVLRGMEFYQGKLIAYSFGNFAGYGSLKTTDNLGISGILDLTFDAESHELIGGRIHSIYLNEKGIPFFDDQGRAVDLINRLSEQDFNENAVKLDPSGAIIFEKYDVILNR